jgi:hypothetical protein
MNSLVTKTNKNNNIEEEINLYFSKVEECREV